MELTLIPSRDVLNIQPDETILAALLRQGAPISHSCKDGRCGLCRCSFAVPDFLTVGENSVDMSSVLACQTVPNADCLVEIADPEDVLVVPAQITRGRVIAIDTLAERILRLRVSPDKPLNYAAGQHFEVTWQPDIARSYSVASLASDPNLVVDIQLHYHGRASRYLEEILKVGDTLRIRGPLGAAYLRRSCSAPILCISNNTGLGALIALLRTISEARMANPVFVYVGFSMSEYIYGEAELHKITRTLRNLRGCHVMVGGGILQRSNRLGLLTDALMTDFQDLSQYRVYAFGSPHAVEVTCQLLQFKGAAQERLHAEPFQYST